MKRDRLKGIEIEIAHYRPRNYIAKAMRKLGELGFEFSGHGSGFGGEDFNFRNGVIYINVCDFGSKAVVRVTNDVVDDEEVVVVEELFKGTFGEALRFIQVKKSPRFY